MIISDEQYNNLKLQALDMISMQHSYLIIQDLKI